MARQNNYYRINSSENLAATTSSGATRSGAWPTGVGLARISSSALVYVFCTAGQGATPTATVAAGVQIDISAPEIFVISPGDKIAAITATGTATVNISWLEG